jgi:hypothetical protein
VRRLAAPLRDELGSTLVTAMFVAVVMLLSVFAVISIGTQDASLSVRDISAAQAFYLAESGAERGWTWFRAQPTPPTSQVAPFGDVPDTLPGGLYSVSISPVPGAGRRTYRVSSIGMVRQRSRAVELDVGPVAFTDYLYYTNRDMGPGGCPWFHTGEVIDGPMYTNGYIGIAGDPIFVDDVHTAQSGLMYYNNGDPIESSALSNPPYDHPTFGGEIQMDAPAAGWIAQADLGSIRGIADVTLGGDMEIIFGEHPGGGQAGYVSYRRRGTLRWTHVQIASFNGIMFVNGDCSVSGVLDGQVTIASVGMISIVDDLTYAASDANGPTADCDDILGLVGGTKVLIADNPANQDDCVVHAHIIAIENQGSLVENYASGSPRGTLTFHGGLGQDKWGPVGTGQFIPGGDFVILTGYERDVHYDWRLRHMLPPGYEHLVYDQSTYRTLAWREVPSP